MTFQYLMYRLKYILSKLSFDKTKRRLKRQEYADKIANLKLKNSKWGVSYSVFNGYELLEQSILSIKDSVDYINIVYQDVSYKGKPCDPELIPFLNSLLERKLVDELIFYKGASEIKKRNLGLKAAKKANVNYFMTMDCDEFFIKEEFESAKRFIVAHNITHSYTPIIHYHIKPTVRSLVHSYYLPFFAKINAFSKMKRPTRITPCYCDPTRVVSYLQLKLFDIYFLRFDRQYVFNDINMHHMTTIRKDLFSKISKEEYENKYLPFINKIKAAEDKNMVINDDFMIVPNIFNIKI